MQDTTPNNSAGKLTPNPSRKRKFSDACSQYFTAKRMAYLGVFTALAVVLYNFATFSLPFFPGFLSFHVSDIPVLLSGFMLGPLAGVIAVVCRFLLKMPFSSTLFIGETADLILGLVFVLTSAFFYKYKRTLKGAVIGVSLGSLLSLPVAVLLNRFVLVPFFVEALLDGNWELLLNMVRPLYADITRETFFRYYLLFATLPFNLLRTIFSGGITLLLYKRLKRVVDRMILSMQSKRKFKAAEVEMEEVEAKAEDRDIE